MIYFNDPVAIITSEYMYAADFAQNSETDTSEKVA